MRKEVVYRLLLWCDHYSLKMFFYTMTRDKLAVTKKDSRFSDSNLHGWAKPEIGI